MRILASLSALPLLVGALHAQCLSTVGGVSAGLVPTTTFYTADDEGRSPPIDMLFGPAGFPMAGAVGPLTHVVVGSNGELYLTSGGAPVDPIDYGAFDVNDLRGIAGASPRVFPFSTDLEGISAGWAVTVDTSVAGSCKVNWIDVEEYFSGGPQFSFSATLTSGGTIEFSYGTLPATAFGIAGVSIGNGVGTGLELPVDLIAGPDSGTLGLMYQEMDGFMEASFARRSILLVPNSSGGFLSIVTCQPANHTAYGFGCHADTSSVVQLFPGTPAAKTALDGNALLFTVTGSSYAANWLPAVAGALYVPPSGTATSLALTDDSNASITPSVAAPIPGGTTATWTISSNGILTAGASGPTYYFANLDDVGLAPELTFYCWRDYNPAIVGSGAVKYEEVAGVLYVTYDGVYEFATTNPATFQWQINLATGDVMMVFVSMATSANTTAMVVGASLAGVGPTPVSSTLSTVTPILLSTQMPLTLSAAPAPVINPSTVVTYMVDGLPEFVPTSGIYLSTLFLSVTPNPGGFDLQGILTTVPGCNAWILTLDLDLGAQVTFAPTATWNVTYSNTFFAPGNVIAAQAVALFDSNFPLANGESGGFLVSNGVRSYVDTQ
jgi:hypothetical protein